MTTAALHELIGDTNYKHTNKLKHEHKYHHMYPPFSPQKNTIIPPKCPLKNCFLE